MEITINLRISADDTLTSLLKSLMGGTVTKPGTAKVAKIEAPKEEEDEDLVGNGAPKVTVEELRETAASLMAKNKAALKTILTKFNAKTVAALTEDQYADALADMKKSLK